MRILTEEEGAEVDLSILQTECEIMILNAVYANTHRVRIGVCIGAALGTAAVVRPGAELVVKVGERGLDLAEASGAVSAEPIGVPCTT
jgi:hypothetical protein